VSVADAEVARLKAELAEAKARDAELSASFLRTCTKLASVCSAFGIDASL
jgi:hypothetical protein